MKIDSTNINLLKPNDYQNSDKKIDKNSYHEGIGEKQDKESSSAFSLDLDQFNNSEISNDKIIHTSEENLADNEKFTKNILDNIIGQLFANNEDIAMFPKGLPKNLEDVFQNPYSSQNNTANTSGMMVNVHQEYYQKQTLDFSTSLTIQTPNQTYEMEISISITQELYISRESSFAFDKSKALEPISLSHDKDENPFGNMEKLHLIFDKAQEDKDDMQEWFKKILELLDNYDSNKEQTQNKDMISIYSERYEGSYELTSVVDTNQGKAIYLSSTQMSYSYESINYQSSSNTENENTLDITI